MSESELDTRDALNHHVRETDARIHAQMRSTPLFFLVSMGSVALAVLSLRMHWVDTVPRELVIVATATFVLSWIFAFVAYRRRGVHSSLYEFADALEGAALAGNNLVYIVLVPSPHNFGWLVHFLFVLHSAQSPKQRGSYSALYLGVPAIAFVAHLALGAWDLAAAAAIYGALVWQMKNTLQASSLATAEQQVRALALQSQVRALQVKAERARIARDLHDGVSAELHALIWLAEQDDTAQAGERVDLSARLRATSDELRDVVWGLSAAEKPWGDWLTDMRVRCRELCGHAMQLEFAYDEHSAGPVSAQAQHALTRILLEATRNSVRHSGGRKLRIHLQRTAQDLSLEISDDGCGFGDGKALASPRGLSNMRHRARELGGRCEIGGSDTGALLRVQLPSAPRADQSR